MKFVFILIFLSFTVGYSKTAVKLYDKNGNEIPLSKDKLTILNFMAYSCGHCMAEIPIFKKVLSKPEYRDKFLVYAFALDGKENNLKDATFPIYANNPRNNVIFPVMGTPTTYIVDHTGKKLQIIYGSITEKSLDNFLKQSLEKHKN